MSHFATWQEMLSGIRQSGIDQSRARPSDALTTGDSSRACPWLISNQIPQFISVKQSEIRVRAPGAIGC